MYPDIWPMLTALFSNNQAYFMFIIFCPVQYIAWDRI